MMSANCSVVVTLSFFSRPCRTQCCSAKCWISTCVGRPGPRRVAMPMHTDASTFRQAVMVYPNESSQELTPSPQDLTRTNSCRVKLTFTTAQRCWFLRSRPTSHACSCKDQQTTSSRPRLFVEVCPRSIAPANHFRQLLSKSNQFQMHVSRALNSPLAIARDFAA